MLAPISECTSIFSTSCSPLRSVHDREGTLFVILARCKLHSCRILTGRALALLSAALSRFALRVEQLRHGPLCLKDSHKLCTFASNTMGGGGGGGRNCLRRGKLIACLCYRWDPYKILLKTPRKTKGAELSRSGAASGRSDLQFGV